MNQQRHIVTKKRAAQSCTCLPGHAEDSGAALVVVVGLLMVVLILGSMFPSLVAFESLAARKFHASNRAYCAARAGMETAIAKITADTNGFDTKSEKWRYDTAPYEATLSPEESFEMLCVGAEECLGAGGAAQKMPESLLQRVRRVYSNTAAAINVNLAPETVLTSIIPESGLDKALRQRVVSGKGCWGDFKSREAFIAFAEKRFGEAGLARLRSRCDIVSAYRAVHVVGKVNGQRQNVDTYRISAIIEGCGDKTRIVYWKEQ